MIKRIIPTIVLIILTLLVFSTYVYSWVTKSQSTMIEQIKVETIHNQDFLVTFENPNYQNQIDLEGLIYLTTNQLNNPETDFNGLSSRFGFFLTNTSSSDINLEIEINYSVYLDNEFYAITPLIYLITNQDINGLVNQLLTDYHQIDEAVRQHQKNHITIPKESNKRFDLFIWGNYDLLNNYLKDYYDLLEYDLTISFTQI